MDLSKLLRTQSSKLSAQNKKATLIEWLFQFGCVGNQNSFSNRIKGWSFSWTIGHSFHRIRTMVSSDVGYNWSFFRSGYGFSLDRIQKRGICFPRVSIFKYRNQFMEEEVYSTMCMECPINSRQLAVR